MDYIFSEDKKRERLWDSATELEKDIAWLLYTCARTSALHKVRENFLFADKLRDRVPEYGASFILKVAKLAGVFKSFVYSILDVARLYTLDEFERLDAAASKHGVTVLWGHLRTITEKLGKPELSSIRKEIEKQLVKRQYSLPQLKSLILHRLQKCASCDRESVKTKKRTKTAVNDVLSYFKNAETLYEDWHALFNGFGEALANPEKVDEIKKESTILLKHFSNMQRFINKSKHLLELFLTHK